jgi:hypothetical protein
MEKDLHLRREAFLCLSAYGIRRLFKGIRKIITHDLGKISFRNLRDGVGSRKREHPEI